VIPLAIILIWQVPITHTTNAILNFATNSDKHIVPAPGDIPTERGTTSVEVTTPSDVEYIEHEGGSSTYLSTVFRRVFFLGSSNQNITDILSAKRNAIITFGTLAGYPSYPGAATADYVPTVLDMNTDIPPRLPAFFSRVIVEITHIAKFFVINVLPVLGIGVLFFQARKKFDQSRYGFLIFGIVSYSIIALIILIPYLQQYYNISRLYLQMFPVISILAIIGGISLTKHMLRQQVGILTVSVALLFCSFTGAIDQVTGGEARITLNQPPSNLDAFYIYDAEVASAQWLSNNRTKGSPVQADVVAGLRLQSFGNMASYTAIFPETINQNSYVYLSANNVEREQALVLYKNNLLTYNYPLAFLKAHKNLIYTNGRSEIYR
jgi:hypothetical protein